MPRRTVATILAALLTLVVALGAGLASGVVTVPGWGPQPTATIPGGGVSAAPTTTAAAGPSASLATAAPPSTDMPSASPVPPTPVLPSSSPTPMASSLPTPTPLPAARLQKSLDAARSKAGIPGVSVTILWPDGRSWTGVSGLANVATGQWVTPDTEFAIASMSKTFLATLILSLVQDGRLSLDDPVATLLPGVSVPPGVTVRMLLDHTSGLADFFMATGIDAALLANRDASWTVAQDLAWVGKPLFAPGRGWYYSNTNYVLLGLIAEKVGGRPVSAQLRTRFFEPLGLQHTYVQLAEEPRGPTTHGYNFTVAGRAATPMDLADGTDAMPFTSVVTAARSAGNIASTSADLAAWARAVYGGQVLDPATLALAVADQKRTAPFHPTVPYGLGIQVTKINGHVAYGHSGRLLGFRGELRYLPADGYAIAIVTNQSRTDIRPIVAALLKIAMPAPVPVPVPSPSSAPSTSPVPAPTVSPTP